MLRNRIFLSLVAVLAFAVAGYSGWRYLKERNTLSCNACMRPLHTRTKTLALIDGKRSVYCCPACARSEHLQESKPMQILELSDYATGKPMKPEGSFLVQNSDVNPCLQHDPAVGESHHPLESRFDRCAPSVIAFPDQPMAAAFAGRHGGKVVSFSDFASSLTQ